MSGLNLYSVVDRVDSRLTEQYLNTFWRESGHFVPWQNNEIFKKQFSLCKFNSLNRTLERLLSGNDINLPDQSSLTQIKKGQGHCKSDVFAYYLKNSSCWLIGEVNHASLMGYHRYGSHFFLISDKARLYQGVEIEVRRLENSLQLGTLLVFELGERDQLNAEKQINLITMIENSERNIRSFIERKLNNSNSGSVSTFRKAEQGLVFGHPFHIISKASTGFNDKEKNKYSPELGAEFCLHYFAVKTESLIRLSSIDVDPVLDPNVLSLFESTLGSLAKEYTLHPCHPWQAKYLFSKSSFNDLLDNKTLVSLGEVGAPVWPTSSVRTVWQPSTRQFIKLALNIRITNFVRNNPLCELERAIDVSQVVNYHKNIQLKTGQNNLTKSEDSKFTVLPETHCQTIKTTDINLQSAFSILYRKGGINEQEPQVLAFLLEEDITTGDTPVARILKEYADTKKSELNRLLILDWWKKNLTISLIPLIRLYADHGISLEAHLQNCMMSFHNGQPEHFYVRDMEGASINVKDRCILPKESAACYSEEDAWFRFKYYVIVNHIGHFIATISRTKLIEENCLWTLTIETLFSEYSQGSSNREKDTRYLNLITDLSTSPFLPAKMNMTSRFNQSSENPGWIDIPNPMNEIKSEVMNNDAA